jgi:hypothetical protein
MSRYRRLKIEGEAFFYTLALADWSFCSFYRYVVQGILPGDWAGDAAELSDASVNEGVGTALRAFAHPTLARFCPTSRRPLRAGLLGFIRSTGY